MSLPSFEYRLEPFGDHQARLFPLRREQRGWAHFWEMGTGKSWEICHEAAWAHHLGEIDCMVVMAKKGEYANWAQFLIPDLMPLTSPVEVVLFNSTAYSSGKLNEQLASLCTPKEGVLRILVVNVESMAYRLPEVKAVLCVVSARGFLFHRRVYLRQGTEGQAIEGIVYLVEQGAYSTDHDRYPGYPIAHGPLRSVTDAGQEHARLQFILQFP